MVVPYSEATAAISASSNMNRAVSAEGSFTSEGFSCPKGPVEININMTAARKRLSSNVEHKYAHAHTCAKASIVLRWDAILPQCRKLFSPLFETPC